MVSSRLTPPWHQKWLSGRACRRRQTRGEQTTRGCEAARRRYADCSTSRDVATRDGLNYLQRILARVVAILVVMAGVGLWTGLAVQIAANVITGRHIANLDLWWCLRAAVGGLWALAHVLDMIVEITK